MDDFIRAAIEDTIREISGRIKKIDLCSFSVPTPMGMFMDAAHRFLDATPSLFWIDEGIPGHYVIKSEQYPAAVFHSRQLELCAHFRSLYCADEFGHFRPAIAQQFCLRVLAEFLLQQRNVDQALQTFAKSAQFVDGMHFLEPQLLHDLEEMEIDECYLAVWFHGLAHELGHTPSRRLDALLDECDCLRLHYIEGLIPKVIERVIHSGAARDQLTHIVDESKNCSAPFSYADPRTIRTEAVADVCGTLILCESASIIFPTCGCPKIDAEALFFELWIASATLTILQQCKILSGWFNGGIERETYQQNLLLSNVSLQVRNNILVRFIQGEVADPRLDDLSTSLRSVFAEFEWGFLDSLSEWFAARDADIEIGLREARAFMSSAEMRNPELLYKYLERVSGDPLSRVMAAPFVNLIEVLNIHTKESELLTKLVAPSN